MRPAIDGSASRRGRAADAARAHRAVVRRPAPSRRRVRRRILWLLGLLCAVVSVRAVLTTPLLYVRRVVVTGTAGLLTAEREAIRARAAVPPRTGLVRAPLGHIAAAVSGSPIVASATVSRHWPDRLDVHVRPRVPIALLESPSGRWELDEAAVAVRAARADAALPRILYTPARAVRVGERLDDPAVVGAVAAALASGTPPAMRIREIEVDPNANMCLNMSDQVVVTLGQTDDLATKLALLRRAYEVEPNIAARVATIDLRCPQATACTPRMAAHEGAAGSSMGRGSRVPRSRPDPRSAEGDAPALARARPDGIQTAR